MFCTYSVHLPVVLVVHVLRAALGEQPRDALADVGAGRRVARRVRPQRGRAHCARGASLKPPPPPPLPAKRATKLVTRTTYFRF